MEESPEFLNRQGNALAKAGRNEEALAYYDKAISLDRACEKAWKNKAVVLRRLGREDEAGECRAAAARIGAGQPPAPPVRREEPATVPGPASGTPVRTPALAALLSLVIPGLGQVYDGDIRRGRLFLIECLVGYILFFVPGVVIHAWSIADAVLLSRKINSGMQRNVPVKRKDLLSFAALGLAGYFLALIAFAGFMSLAGIKPTW